MFEARLAAFEINLPEDGSVNMHLDIVDSKQLREVFDKQLPEYEGTEMLVDIIEYVAGRLRQLERDVAKRYKA